MRVFITVLVLIFSLQSLSKADDISNFEIEGMSVGNSLLDYFSREKIEQEKNSKYVYKYKDNRFFLLGIGDHNSFPLYKNLESYDELGVVIKPKDKNYKIYSISGEIFCPKSIDICLSKKKKILSELKNVFGNKANFSSYVDPHKIDPSGNSIVYGSEFNLSNDNSVSVNVYEWSNELKNEKNYQDILKVSMSLKDYSDFIRYEAYK